MSFAFYKKQQVTHAEFTTAIGRVPKKCPRRPISHCKGSRRTAESSRAPSKSTCLSSKPCSMRMCISSFGRTFNRLRIPFFHAFARLMRILASASDSSYSTPNDGQGALATPATSTQKTKGRASATDYPDSKKRCKSQPIFARLSRVPEKVQRVDKKMGRE